MYQISVYIKRAREQTGQLCTVMIGSITIPTANVTEIKNEAREYANKKLVGSTLLIDAVKWDKWNNIGDRNYYCDAKNMSYGRVIVRHI